VRRAADRDGDLRDRREVDHLLARDREQRGLPVAHALHLVDVDPVSRALAHRVRGEQVLHEQ
jgi:hypothetical protein